MVGDVGDRRAAQPDRGVVPAQWATRRVVGAVVPVAFERGEVDAAHERQLAVDDDDLLVVAVHEVLAVVQRTLHRAVADELVTRLLDHGARRVERAQRRTGPHQQPHVDALGRLREQVAEGGRAGLAAESEVRRAVPTGDVHGRLRTLDGLLHRTQRRHPVDEDGRLVAAAHLGSWRPPAASLRLHHVVPADPAQTPVVPVPLGPLESLTDPVVDQVETRQPGHARHRGTARTARRAAREPRRGILRQSDDRREREIP